MTESLEKTTGLVAGLGSGCAFAGAGGALVLGWCLYSFGNWLAHAPGDTGVGAILGPLLQIAGVAALLVGALILGGALLLLGLGGAALRGRRSKSDSGTD